MKRSRLILSLATAWPQAGSPARLRLGFPAAADRQYRIEVSLDGEHWQDFALGKRFPPARSRFVRVTFETGDPTLADFSAQGSLEP